MRILLVEDDPNTVLYLQRGLCRNGFAVDATGAGDAALGLALAHDYDLVILDVMLPVRNGWLVLRDLRNADRQMPVLFLTARDAVVDRVKGLELGADDYLVKPFAFSELLARVQTLLRRSNSQRDVIRVADLVVDLVRHRATRGNQRLDLRPKELALLTLLARRSGEVLSRSFIARQVWDMNVDCDSNVVDVHIRRLRSKVDDPFDRNLIHTVRGAGYVLEESDK